MAAQSFDLAEALQTPVILVSDLDLGMNDHVCDPFEWDDNRKYNRGKVLSEADLDALDRDWGRYLDSDNDGVCYRTYPGTHPEKGAYFTRGSSHDEYASYTEDNAVYKRGMERLGRKWETAKTMVPEPEIHMNDGDAAIIFYGTTAHAAQEAVELLEKQGEKLNTMRIKSFPFTDAVTQFIERHDRIFVAEQNRDGQMRTIIINELDVPPEKVFSIAHMDGTPPDASSICNAVIQTTQGGAA